MLYMPFLYFPEDKSEYLLPGIMLIIFMIFAGIALYFVYKRSKKDEEKFTEQYKEQLQEIEKDSDSNK